MNKQTGGKVTGLSHLRQSIEDILTTPLASRIMLPEYGSRIFDLLDNPLNAYMKIELYSAVQDALERWEPRFKLTQVNADFSPEGRVSLTLTGQYLPEGKTVTLDGLIIQ